MLNPVFLLLALPVIQGIHNCTVEDPETLESELRIAAWNSHGLDQTKIGKSDVIHLMVQVILRYDIICLSEITDSTVGENSAPQQLLAEVQLADSDYDLALSEKVGDAVTSSMEQYGCYYRRSRVALEEALQFSDTAEEHFKYDPFVLIFTSSVSAVEKFALITIHTSPSVAAQEIDALSMIYDNVISQFDVEDALILGDFNAGCDYVSTSEWDTIDFFNNPRYTWLISGHQDTTVKLSTTCPYDRIVAAGSLMQEYVYENTAKPFYFDEEFGLTDEDLIEDTSDHYPVEVWIQGKVSTPLVDETKVSIGFSLEFTSLLEHINSFMVDENTNFTILADTEHINIVQFNSTSTTTALSYIDYLSVTYPCHITNDIASVVRHKLERHVLTDASIFGSDEPIEKVVSRIMCLKEDCTLTVSRKTSIV